MMKINEVIIVEGIHDISFLKTFIDADFIQTHGSSIPKETIDLIKLYSSNKRDFIILTDPDFPGDQIRNKLLEIIPNAKLAFVDKKKSRTSKKVGVEHSNKNHVLEALSNVITLSNKVNNLSKNDLYELGLDGLDNSSKIREYICNKLMIGKCNSKQFLNRINSIDITKEELSKMIMEYKNEN